MKLNIQYYHWRDMRVGSIVKVCTFIMCQLELSFTNFYTASSLCVCVCVRVRSTLNAVFHHDSVLSLWCHSSLLSLAAHSSCRWLFGSDHETWECLHADLCSCVVVGYDTGVWP